MSERVSVTEVRNALRCPRIFALGRRSGRAVAFPVGSSRLGAAFHAIVDRFARGVQDPPEAFLALPARTARDDVEAGLVRWLLEGLVDWLEREPATASMPQEVDDLAEALRQLAGHLAARVVAFDVPPAAALVDVLRASEKALTAELPLPGAGDTVVVDGKLDAIYGTARGTLEVVEYKLTDEANDLVDRAQVALYRQLLRASDDVEARPVILRFTPTLRETSMDAAGADAFFAATLAPLLGAMLGWAREPASAPATTRTDLCAGCPVGRDCAEIYPARLPARDDPPAPHATASAPLRDAHDAEGEAEAKAFKARILAELKREGVSVSAPKPPIVGPTLYVIEVSKPRGAVSQLDRAADDVSHRLASADGTDARYRKVGSLRQFEIVRRRPRRITLGPLLTEKHEWLRARPGRFIVGVTPSGEILTGDFSDAGTPHVLVAGQTGSGKSVFVQTVLASLVHGHGPESIRFTLVDPKRVTFVSAAFRAAIAAHLDGPIRYDASEAIAAVDALIAMMDERYALFEQRGVIDVDEYNADRGSAPELERRVLVVDEFSDLTADRATAKAFEAGISRLGAKARAAGIHLLLATQRPDAKVVSGIIKANLTGRIALAVRDIVNSRIILDEPGAEQLLGKGDLLAQLGHGLVRAQGALLA